MNVAIGGVFCVFERVDDTIFSNIMKISYVRFLIKKDM